MRDATIRIMSDHSQNAEMMMRIFDAMIERRDEEQFLKFVDPACEMHWPESLPYGGRVTLSTTFRTWQDTWDPLQPTGNQRAMDARIIATDLDKVVVLWHQRGINKSGEVFDGEVLALYEVQQGRLRRAKMFYFNSSAVAEFLAGSRTD
jgi:ketosteroid isomerase-like protein